MIFKIINLLFLLFITCEDLPTENISYKRNPVVFGYIDAGFKRIDPIYLSWSNPFSSSHINSIEYIENATISLSTINNNPEYSGSDITFNYIGNGQYNPLIPDNLQITSGAKWNLEIVFIDIISGEEYILNSSTEIPEAINLTSTSSNIAWNCNGLPIDINENFNLYQEQNTVELIQDWLNSEDLSFLNDIEVDEIVYNTDECYTSSFASVPFFTIDLGVANENIVARYTTIALEPDKDMNLDGINLPFEAAIFDTTLSANAFKGPMNYYNIDYSNFPEFDNIPYEWGWYREPVDRINLIGNVIPIMWLFFDYYGINMMIVQPVGAEYEQYFESDPDEFNFPYILRKTNIQSNKGEAYGLFYSTYSDFFFFNVLPPSINQD
ncbi:MAG: hypothetical protein CMG00_08645 [Candidatus Marinimicrobia bacterium]|nr:hypothetical protein [Candidatus Neomarinimicrobiota bacterium]